MFIDGFQCPAKQSITSSDGTSEHAAEHTCGAKLECRINDPEGQFTIAHFWEISSNLMSAIANSSLFHG
jgi:hypothetical protein